MAIARGGRGVGVVERIARARRLARTRGIARTCGITRTDRIGGIHRVGSIGWVHRVGCIHRIGRVRPVRPVRPVRRVGSVGRVERMQASYDEICSRIGIPTSQLEQVNSTGRGSYRDYYDQALIDGVAALYHRDLELFGYGF